MSQDELERASYCHSCGIPLNIPDVKVMAEKYCQHCTDAGGNVKTREEVQRGIAEWLKSWQPGLDDSTAMARAEHYLRAMPEWAK